MRYPWTLGYVAVVTLVVAVIMFGPGPALAIALGAAEVGGGAYCLWRFGLAGTWRLMHRLLGALAERTRRVGERLVYGRPNPGGLGLRETCSHTGERTEVKVYDNPDGSARVVAVLCNDCREDVGPRYVPPVMHLDLPRHGRPYGGRGSPSFPPALDVAGSITTGNLTIGGPDRDILNPEGQRVLDTEGRAKNHAGGRIVQREGVCLYCGYNAGTGNCTVCEEERFQHELVCECDITEVRAFGQQKPVRTFHTPGEGGAPRPSRLPNSGLYEDGSRVFMQNDARPGGVLGAPVCTHRGRGICTDPQCKACADDGLTFL